MCDGIRVQRKQVQGRGLSAGLSQGGQVLGLVYEQSPVEYGGTRTLGDSGALRSLEEWGWELKLAFPKRGRWAGMGRIED